MLSPKLLAVLRHWWQVERPRHWLFPGTRPETPITRRAVFLACRRAAQRARLAKAVSPHLSPLPNRRRDAPHHSRGPPPPRRRDRLLRRSAHLGPDARPSSPSALRDSGWGAGEQRQRLGCLPPRVLSAGPGPVTLLPSSAPRGAAGRLRVRRARFAGRLQTLSDPRRFAEHLRPARETEWVVYAKRPFAGPEQVLDYLGRYTHRIAISNQRLCSLHDDSVRFRYTDYRRSEEVIVPISIRGRSAPDSRSARKPEVLTLDDLDAPVILVAAGNGSSRSRR